MARSVNLRGQVIASTGLVVLGLGLITFVYQTAVGRPIPNHVIMGDMNGDGAADLADLEPFVRAVADPKAYAAANGLSEDDLIVLADFDGDGKLTIADVPDFAELVSPLSLSESNPLFAGGGMMTMTGGPNNPYVPALDLDVDSDNDNADAAPDRTEGPGSEDEIEGIGPNDVGDPGQWWHEYPGKFVPLNSDDDNNNQTTDCNEPNSGPTENELIPIVLELRPLDPNVTLPPGCDPNCDPNDPNCDPNCANAVAYPIWFDIDPLTNFSDFRLWFDRDQRDGDPNVGDPNDLRLDDGEQYFLRVWLRGDMNGDGAFDYGDVNPFVDAVIDFDAWREEMACGPNSVFPQDMCVRAHAIGDFDDDGVTGFGDINPFVDALTNGEKSFVRLWLWGESCGDFKHTNPPTEFGEPVHITVRGLLGWGEEPEEDSIYVQSGDCGQDWYGYPAGYGEHCYDEGYASRCWFGNFDHGVLGAPSGFPLHMSLADGFGPADLPPRSLDPVQGSSPLVSAGAYHASGLNPHAERVTLEGVVDLITGSPLLQDTDFELPFGGAVFRHVRTYSENFCDHFWSRHFGHYPVNVGELLYAKLGRPESTHWDWNGRFWMMSENPILLIDSAYHDIADWIEGDPGDPNDIGYGVRVCYFIPDAHHAIPFHLEPLNAERTQWAYVAPPWFDAVLTFDDNALMNPDGTWAVRPTEWYVWTQRGTLKYTFTPRYEDLWQLVHPVSQHLVDVHEHPQYPDPNQAGYGIPYYGLVTSIVDRYGHEIEYVYSDDNYQFDCHDEFDPPHDDSCIDRCCQNCNEKGQLKALRLRTGPNPEDVKYTLLYAHRTFAGVTGGEPPAEPTDWMHHNMLHSVYVYEGGAVAIPAHNLTLRYDDSFANLVSFDEYDSIEPNVPPDWILRAQYTYQEYQSRYGEDYDSVYHNAPAGTQYQRYSMLLPDTAGHWYGGYQLLKATITRQEPSDPNSLVVADTVYRYDEARLGGYREPLATNRQRALRYRWSNDACQQVILSQAGTAPESVNEILCASLSTVVLEDDEATPDVYEWATLDRMSDFVFLRNQTLSSAEDLQAAYRDYTNIDLSKATVAGPGVDRLYDQRQLMMHTAGQDSVDNKIHAYAIYRFHVFPSDVDPNGMPIDPNDPNINPGAEWRVFGDHALYHWPYRYDAGWFGGQQDEMLDLPPHDPFHVVVIDDYIPGANPAYTVGGDAALRNRRVVKMNPMGFVLEDTTWSYENLGHDPNDPNDPNADPVIVEHFGTSEKSFYDGKGRLVMLASKGWGSIVGDPNSDPNTEGLVHVFKYFDPNSTAASELQAIGVKQGTGSLDRDPVTGDFDNHTANTYWLKAYDRHPDRPELVTSVAEYAIPELTIPPTNGHTTTYEYEFIEPGNSDSGIRRETKYAPETLRWHDGDYAWCQAVDRTAYDDQGRVEWKGAGHETTQGEKVEYFVNYVEHDDQGNVTKEVIDADPNSGSVATFPDGFSRVSQAAALDLETTYVYDPVYGLREVHRPNGRSTYIHYRPAVSGSAVMHMWEYRDVVFDDPGWRVLSSPKLTVFEGGKATMIREFKYNETWPDPSTGPPEDAQINWGEDVISTTEVSYSPSGQLIGVNKTADGESIETTVSYYIGGTPAREQAPDGTITRYVYDLLGRPTHVFRGTTDLHFEWGTAPPGHENWDDDMVLVEKRYYGNGLTDADKLITVRSFRDRPTNQYHIWDPNGTWIDPDEDLVGWTTDYLYDWRMRPVWVTEHNEVGTALRHTLTWYDHQGRDVLVAEYGYSASPPGALDPTTLPAAWYLNDADDPAALLQAANPPHTVTQKLYNARGQVEETRNWYLHESTPVYTATVTYYDHAGRPVELRSPGAPIEEYLYDAKGRQVRSTSIAAGQAVSESEAEYDSNDRAIVTRHREMDPANPANFVSTFTHSWYDEAGRVIAVANWGTNEDSFSAAADPNGPGYVTGSWPSIGDPNALVTEYDYDEAGRRVEVRHPDSTKSQTLYDDLGRTLLTRDNAGDPNQMLRTAYDFDDAGRLIGIANVDPNYGEIEDAGDVSALFTDPPPTGVQVTSLEYDAEVLPATFEMVADEGGWGAFFDPNDPNSGWAAQSGNNAWVSKVEYPNGRNMRFGYYSDGSVAWRSDSRGVKFYYRYDTRGRLTHVWADDTSFFGSADPNVAPEYRVYRQEYAYEDSGRLYSVLAYAWDNQTQQEVPVALNVFYYDSIGNIEAEQQAHFAEAIPNRGVVPEVAYTWDFSAYDPNDPGSNYNRLESITYPSGGAQVEFDYGTAGSATSVLNLITALNDETQSAYATYGYFGTGRRVSTTLGNGIAQSFGSGTTFDGLDRYGRTIDLLYKLGQNIVHRYQYGYDDGGNRLYAEVEQEGGHDNDRSWAYTYDALSRLVTAHIGELDAGTPRAIVTDQGVSNRRLEWNLDILGNWIGDPNDANDPGFSRYVDAEGNDAFEAGAEFKHAVDSGNELDAVSTTDRSLNPVTVTEDYVYDGSGSLVLDGQFFYQYDAFNRLMQVNLAGDLTAADFNANGKITSQDDPGQKLAAFVYDGFGRLIRTQRWDPQGNSEVESYYYDGVRRIQERVDDDPNDPNSAIATREYVWGPGYVDEIVCQVDEQGDLLYYLQDANYNVVAVTDEDGAVVAQYAYEPYGGVVVADAFTTTAYPDPNAPPINRIGHQGLFFERLYVDADDPNDPNDPYDTLSDPALSPPTDPNLATPLPGLYQVRNRVLIPNLGRFAQRDMVHTALPIITALSMNAQVMDVVISGFDAALHYNDGLNLYAFAGSDPITARDPAGLWLLVDMMITEGYEQSMTNLSLSSGATFMGALAGFLGLVSDRNLELEEFAGAASEGNIDGALLAVEAASRLRATMVAAGILRAGMSVASSVGGKAGLRAQTRTRTRLKRFGPGVCWNAGSLVLTASADVPIETLDVGERVLTSDWAHPGGESADEVQTGTWLHVFGNDASATSVNRETWRLVELSMPNPLCPDDIIEIRSLRPLTWIAETGCRAGEPMWYVLPEMGLAGMATVESIEPCPEIEVGIGRVVLSTVTHLNGYVRRIWLEGHDEPLEPTNTHRLYSEDRGDWVPAGALAVGEQLRTVAGPVRIARIDIKPGVHRVYNLEVETEHCYYVSTAGVLSHNTNPCKVTAYDDAVRVLKRQGTSNINMVSQKQAEAALRAARPGIQPNFTYGKATRGKFGYEVHPPDGSGVNMPHIKWWDWRAGKRFSGGSSGHIYFEGL